MTSLQSLRDRLRARRRRRGVALIMVLGSIAILTVMLTEVQDDSSSDFSATIAARDQLAAEYAAKSAINLTRLLIATEPTVRQAAAPLALLFGGKMPQLPVWEYANEVLGAFNDQVGKESFSALSGLDLSQGEHLGLEGASFEVDVVDEDSKININWGSREPFSRQRLTQQLIALTAGPQYEPLFAERDADGEQSSGQDICSAMIDWTDSDQDHWPCDGSEMAQQAAPEDSFYERLDKPYTRKNAPFDSLLELYRVRGVGEDYWSTFIEPDPDDPGGRIMTVWGQGPINVNSANPQVLLALICQQAEPNTKVCDGADGTFQLLAMLELLKGLTGGAPIFGSPDVFLQTLQGGGMLGPMLIQQGIEPVKIKSPDELKKSLSVESKVFSIHAKGIVRSGKRESTTRIHAVVDFRQAPPPGQATTAEQARAQLQEQAEQMRGLQDALKPSAAGSIVYYRVD